MSRLDSFIRRLEAQRACLNQAAILVKNVPGVIYDIGLGNGRTFDHLRSLFPDGRIFVFDRQINAHPDCIPVEHNIFLGEVTDTLPQALRRHFDTVRLMHIDIGTGDSVTNKKLMDKMIPYIDKLVTAKGLVISDQPMNSESFVKLDLPEGIDERRYYMYQKR